MWLDMACFKRIIQADARKDWDNGVGVGGQWWAQWEQKVADYCSCPVQDGGLRIGYLKAEHQ